jgi:hypothetical protein
VGQDCEALLLLRQNAFYDNSVKKTTFSVSPATRKTDEIHCLWHFSSTQVSDHKALLCTGYLQPILQYREEFNSGDRKMMDIVNMKVYSLVEVKSYRNSNLQSNGITVLC